MATLAKLPAIAPSSVATTASAITTPRIMAGKLASPANNTPKIAPPPPRGPTAPHRSLPGVNRPRAELGGDRARPLRAIRDDAPRPARRGADGAGRDPVRLRALRPHSLRGRG